jgi:hypothetical protein
MSFVIKFLCNLLKATKRICNCIWHLQLKFNYLQLKNQIYEIFLTNFQMCLRLIIMLNGLLTLDSNKFAKLTPTHPN